MISNERQYRNTKAQITRFEQSLNDTGLPSDDMDTVIQEELRAAIRGEIDLLYKQVSDYEEFRSGRIRVFASNRFEDLADMLILARIASRLTQRELAEELGVKEQQIQRYEATSYESASFTRLVNVVNVLGLNVDMRIALPKKAINSSQGVSFSSGTVRDEDEVWDQAAQPASVAQVDWGSAVSDTRLNGQQVDWSVHLFSASAESERAYAWQSV